MCFLFHLNCGEPKAALIRFPVLKWLRGAVTHTNGLGPAAGLRARRRKSHQLHTCLLESLGPARITGLAQLEPASGDRARSSFSVVACQQGARLDGGWGVISWPSAWPEVDQGTGNTEPACHGGAGTRAALCPLRRMTSQVPFITRRTSEPLSCCLL